MSQADSRAAQFFLLPVQQQDQASCGFGAGSLVFSCCIGCVVTSVVSVRSVTGNGVGCRSRIRMAASRGVMLGCLLACMQSVEHM